MSSKVDLRGALPEGFDSMVYCVPSGTVVGRDNEGNEMTVTDTVIVNLGHKYYVTEPVFEDIKKRTAKRLS